MHQVYQQALALQPELVEMRHILHIKMQKWGSSCPGPKPL